ncbi:pyrimidine 5'-nucleotidase [Notoacmeibacter sp. MSK16QG-6]|uniref:pyrimidine 5'-nucleotidase n=1 Tax=Notoacmeibacter sp. MSK16QG-6 TaxID=2957982 RepID=UPI0020A0570E|nr:pyrimidine 5'-nucleotidase [Notoacmeibacter sp. MSK16QG-6]MCP1198723.1 pyrimidine 5'-nucleotidase [Notoacmeibacter sp. MSK16QG-6]
MDSPAPAFAHVTEWVFDLDNTLYPSSADLFSQIDQRMTQWIANYLDVERDEAFRVQKALYREHGTTLRGLIERHKVDTDDFLAFVHDIDYSALTPDIALGDAIKALPGRRFIFTNGDRPHAERTARALGILDHFDDIFDIVAADMTPKPGKAPYNAFLAAHGVHPKKAAMFEDMARNLAVPKALGMVTVLVEATERPSFKQDWEVEQADEIDFVTSDLSAFLTQLIATR